VRLFLLGQSALFFNLSAKQINSLEPHRKRALFLAVNVNYNPLIMPTRFDSIVCNTFVVDPARLRNPHFHKNIKQSELFPRNMGFFVGFFCFFSKINIEKVEGNKYNGCGNFNI